MRPARIEISRLPMSSPWGLGSATILGREELNRPEGYALPAEKTLAITLEAGGLRATGYGEGIEDLAEKRAYSEAVERLALLDFCRRSGTAESSNGWAAHTDPKFAVDAAILELIERDVALTTWENGGPFYLLPEFLWPEVLRNWQFWRNGRYEYHDLKILLSSSANGACLSALLFNKAGNFVAGHGSALMIEKAILSAAHECFRAAHSALRFEHIHEVMALHRETNLGRQFEPGAHSLAYAYGETLPQGVSIELISEIQAVSLWSRHQESFKRIDYSKLDISLIEAGSRIVARVKSPRYRQIFWGQCRDNSKRNLRPHFVG